MILANAFYKIGMNYFLLEHVVLVGLYGTTYILVREGVDPVPIDHSYVRSSVYSSEI